MSNQRSKRAKSGGGKRPGPGKLRNEPGEPPANVFPKGDEIDLKTARVAGVRIGVERALQRLHDYGDDMWAEIGYDKRQLARNRKAVVEALRRIALDPQTATRLARSGAVTMLGELGRADAIPALGWVLESSDESVGTRGWAAAAIGRIGGEQAVSALKRSASDPSPVVRRRVMEALGDTREKAALRLLRDAAERDEDRAVAATARASLRGLEEALGQPVSPAGRPRRQKRRRRSNTAPPKDPPATR